MGNLCVCLSTEKALNLEDQKTPWFSDVLKEKIQKVQRNELSNQEHAKLLREIAEVTVNFYPVKQGQCIAIRLTTGEIVETAENELALLKKIQGKGIASQVFVWKVGSNSFAGWKACRQ